MGSVLDAPLKRLGSGTTPYRYEQYKPTQGFLSLARYLRRCGIYIMRAKVLAPTGTAFLCQKNLYQSYRVNFFCTLSSGCVFAF